MRLTLDLQATHPEQDDLFAWARERFPALAELRELRLDGSGERPGLRAKLAPLGLKAEAELAVSCEAGALVVEFEEVRQNVLGAVKLPRAAWGPIVRGVVRNAQATLPPGVSLELDGEPRFLRVRVAGLSFQRVLILRDRLSVRLER